MLFNTFAFLVFFVIVSLLYWITPHKYRWIVLLVFSYYFYLTWNVRLGVLIGTTTLVSYLSGILMEKTDKKSIKKLYMLISIITSLSILFFFKYFNFISESTVLLLQRFGIPISPFTLKILLPVGISFYTFQTLSYSIDIYYGRIKAERHLGYYSLFVVFFPQLVAGPIERPENLLPQLKKVNKLDGDNFVIGLKWMLLGFFKKICVSDILAKYVDAVYNSPSEANGLSITIATVLFAVQILCDFDGYTNIAIGIAKTMNIDLVQNFNNPYAALSIKDFWSRWHISLTSWFRDYVYIPLGGNRVSKPRHLANIMITFLLSGIWHGANFTFIIWGALHGLYQVFGILTSKFRKRLYSLAKINTKSTIFICLQRFTTFALVVFAWLFFRANSIADVGVLITKLFTDWHFNLSYVNSSMSILNIHVIDLTIIVSSIALLYWLTTRVTTDIYSKGKLTLNLEHSVAIDLSKWLVYACLFVGIVFIWISLATQTDYQNAFIYFQF